MALDHHHPDVRLRPWHRGDVVPLLDAVASSPDLGRQFGGTGPRSSQEALSVIETAYSWSESSRVWAIELQGRAVGSVAVSHLDRDHDSGWVSYWVADVARGRGLATVAAASAAAWVLAHDNLFRLELGHRVNNPASCRVALGAGFLVEGVERQKLRYGSERFDVETHSRLATDPVPTCGTVLVSGP